MANTTQQYQYSDPDLGGPRNQANSTQRGNNLQNINQNFLQLLRDRPAAAFLGALAAGFLVGRLFARR